MKKPKTRKPIGDAPVPSVFSVTEVARSLNNGESALIKTGPGSQGRSEGGDSKSLLSKKMRVFQAVQIEPVRPLDPVFSAATGHERSDSITPSSPVPIQLDSFRISE